MKDSFLLGSTFVLRTLPNTGLQMGPRSQSVWEGGAVPPSDGSAPCAGPADTSTCTQARETGSSEHFVCRSLRGLVPCRERGMGAEPLGALPGLPLASVRARVGLFRKRALQVSQFLI